MKKTPLENWIMQCVGKDGQAREALEEYQLARIKDTLSYVKSRSRFYAKQLEDMDLREIHTLSDLRRIPFTLPQDIQDDPFAFLCVPKSEIARIVTLRSTGTKGDEKRVFFSESDMNQTVDFFLNGMSCLVDETDRVLVLLPGDSYGSIGQLLKKALEGAHIACFVQGVITDAAKTAEEIIEKNITCLVGIPTQIRSLSRTHSELFGRRIKSVLLSTDYVPEKLIEELTGKFGCRVFTHYGMTEMGYGGGVECEALSGYHLREADLYFEIIDPNTGLSLPDGEAGEVVFTTLTRQAMPLIRYRTGDIASFSKNSCACGTFLKTMSRVKGRLENRICLGGNEILYHWELDEAVFAHREIEDYKAAFTENNCLELELSMYDSADLQKSAAELAASIQQLAGEKFGHEIELRISQAQSEAHKITNSMTKRIFRN